ncbi:MAG TPA: DUF3025 domain-containing protein [Polyangia bacterium]
MPSIRRIRRALPFDPTFVARHPLSWPLARAARAFGDAGDWPPVSAWSAVFAGAPPIGFTAVTPRPRRARRPRFDRATLYDASIIERGVVPSRERNWHDFLNALVWGTFPRAKAALHRRQAALLAARIDGDAPRLPAHRTREQDGLAMIDEGGVVALEAPAAELCLVFGHALYEGFVLGVPRMTARLVRLPIAALAGDPIAQADAALAARLADPTLSTLPETLPRVFVPDAAVAPWLPPAL